MHSLKYKTPNNIHKNYERFSMLKNIPFIKTFVVSTCVVAGLALQGCQEKTDKNKSISESSAQTTSHPQAIPQTSSKLSALKPSEYEARCEAEIHTAKTSLAALLASPPETSAGVLNSLNTIEILLENSLNFAGLVANVFPDKNLREKGEACEQKLVAFIGEINLSRPLYDLITKTTTDNLNEIDLRYREKTLQDFKRSGVNLNESDRNKIKQLQDEILSIGQEFDRNIRESSRPFILKSDEDLDGLPKDYIEKHSPNEEGEIVLTTSYPDYYPFMQYAKSDELRKRYYQLFNQRAYPENVSVLKKLLEKRYELATLLGFSNYAEYVTQDKMIGSPKNAQEFINKVWNIADKKAKQDYELLLQKLKTIDPHAKKVEDWQKTYLSQRIKSEDYKVDAQEVRQYFQYGKVRDGIFSLIEHMFGVQFKPWETTVWHESVEAFEMWEGNKLIGRFFLDMHPRDGKYGHAAQFSLVSGINGIQTTEAALICNFPGEKNPEAYMEHSDVETFLHEFGHLIHTLFAGVDQTRVYFSGVKTEWDFVEAPSQMLEEWVWDQDTLATFAKNKKGESIPTALFEKMKLAKNVGNGMWSQHQLFYAALSLGLHMENPKDLDLAQFSQKIQKNYSPFDYVEDTHFYNSFGHLNGYSAIYYTYMWSLVIASDMHSEFEKAGLRNSEIARKFRDTILAPGGKKSASDLLHDFLGRQYTFDAFAHDLTAQ